MNNLRPAALVMRLARLGAAFPMRLSFMRVLLRRLVVEKASVRRLLWQIDKAGFGRAVYTVELGGHSYSLVAFATELAPENRTDRVIAQAWDASFVLFDGVPDRADLDRLAANAPLQEAGRFSARELVLCRANKSVRMFDHVVAALANGQQPDADMVQAVGYLMRTTAVYGNGKFGIADRAVIATRPGLSGPFAAEMLAVWLVRGFTHDLVEHVAAGKSAKAVRMAMRLKRHLGIGNATGLGMAPYLVSHPTLLNNWVLAREVALARVLDQRAATADQVAAVLRLMARVAAHLGQWRTEDARQMGRISVLRDEWADVMAVADQGWLDAPDLWARLMALAADKSVECQELMVALVLEPHGPLVDDLADDMASDTLGIYDPAMTLERVQGLIAAHFGWALAIDFTAPDQCALFWYISAEKQEPRLGERDNEPGAERELPLDIARQVQALAADLARTDKAQTLAEFLAAHPAHRAIAKRVQLAPDYPYAELHDNLIADTCLPIDMLRCKLAFFGASKFDPKSDRWTRITMYQGAPLFDEISREDADDWWLPVLEGAA
ncbi:MAG: hypothetical protein GXP03_02225 [Alphaproteobacteria bacterium]|nr:hypothetical protein [Alphaproteobacteria bacterium]